MRSCRYFSLFLSLAVCSAAILANRTFAADPAIARVAVIGVDGAGAFFREAETPNIDEIFKDGAVSYDVLTSKPTISAECWSSMLHGVTPEFHGRTNAIVGANPYPTDSPFPSVFRVIRENMPDAKLASFCNWNPINIGIIEDNLGVTKGTAGGDSAVTDLVCDYLEKNDPTLLFVQFDECDHAGHTKEYGSAAHLAQIGVTDGYIKRIYDAYAKRGLADSTLFVVTADHGGLGTSHGGWSDGEKYIMFAAAGPGVEKGTIGEMAVRDTASVALYALGLADKQPEGWTSRVPSGLFKGVEAAERPVCEIKYAYEHRTHEPSPTPEGEGSAPAILGKDRVRAYLPFDGNVKDAMGKVETRQNGKLYFVDGYFGEGAQMDDGWISLGDLRPDKDSFSVAAWVKTKGVDDDPCLLSNKNWTNGTLSGFVLALRPGDMKFNVGADGKARADAEFKLPFDYRDGWIYVVLVVDRAEGVVRFSYDFGDFVTKKLGDNFDDVSFNSDLPLHIGQDGTGKYRVNLGAELDEFLFIDGALTKEDVEKLKALYL